MPSAQSRALLRQQAQRILRANDIPFTTNNDGAHLIIPRPSGEFIDFWPGTNTWQLRGKQTFNGHPWKRMGLDTLIEFYKGERNGV